LFDVSARIFVDVVVVVVVFLLDLDRAARTGCVIKAKWWLGRKFSDAFARGDVNIESIRFSLLFDFGSAKSSDPVECWFFSWQSS